MCGERSQESAFVDFLCLHLHKSTSSGAFRNEKTAEDLVYVEFAMISFKSYLVALSKIRDLDDSKEAPLMSRKSIKK